MLPQGPCWRCRQRHLDCYRLQLPTHPRLAEGSLAPHPERPYRGHQLPIASQIGFSTDDQKSALGKAALRRLFFVIANRSRTYPLRKSDDMKIMQVQESIVDELRDHRVAVGGARGLCEHERSTRGASGDMQVQESIMDELRDHRVAVG
jgi:hypothetical protein